jgi:hypothetical protein
MLDSDRYLCESTDVAMQEESLLAQNFQQLTLQLTNTGSSMDHLFSLPCGVYISMIGISALNMSCGVASGAKRIVNDSDIAKERGEKCLITWNNTKQNRQPESNEVRNSSTAHSINTISG